MDAKERYSEEVRKAMEMKAKGDKSLGLEIAKGQDRKWRHRNNWTSVNINDVITKYAPDAVPERKGNKILYKGGKYTVVADIGGGYLRINLTGTHDFLDAKGNSATYYDPINRGHKRSENQINELSHFKIKKREEM